MTVSIAALLLYSCGGGKKDKDASNGPDALASHIDSTVKPGDDFFQYANGKWFKEHPIPASEPTNGIWQLIQDTVNAQIRQVCESSAALKEEPKGSNKQKIGDFFASGMDSATLNKKGITDLKSDFDRIDAIKDIPGIMKEAAYLHAVSSSPLFGFYVGQDDKNSSKNAVFFLQGGLSLPDREYYFAKDKRAKEVCEKFIVFASNMYKIMGYDDAKAKTAADGLMKIETALAKSSRKIEDTRDPEKNYNKYTFKQFTTLTPAIDWKVFLDATGLKNVDSVIVGQPEFLKGLNGYLKSFSMDEWKNYLKFHLLRGLARYMDDKTYMENFGFYSGVLRGVKETKPRWERVVSQTDGSLGELIGQVYVAEYLPKGTKEKLLEIGNAIRDVFAERIKKLDWMSDATKQIALKKLKKIIFKVGYPDKLKDLSKLNVDRKSYVRNVINANRWEFEYMINKYGKPVDRTEWGMQPQTYNAYYNPSNNEICIPGCNIIVPGYERVMADDAILYAIIGGSTFAHEITHGFDDQGSKYDEFGNLNEWWTKDDRTRFEAKTKLLITQFNEYVALDSLRVNGEMTVGENIADLAGVVMGYEAFIKTKQFKENQKIAGLTAAQRYFLGYALAWMVNVRPEYLSNQVRTDVHSPARFRVLGPLANMPEFYSAFGVKKGDKMWRPDSLIIKIW
ncbi:MAG: M13 family metallopeptidase [Bacteroidota bacterium]